MRVLIVEPSPELGKIWKAHLERAGCDVLTAETQAHAITVLQTHDVAVIVLDLVLEDGSAFAVADFASYRQPEAHVVFVTNTTFFSDGSIFQHVPNARAFVQRETPPNDLTEMVRHYGRPG
ncbi:response regulator [Aliiroseovarius sp. YM-037]|uniref:response regulator n=1 Tax=Aliiroseovarius sp. YM-037 TaxID=3341728 RepID=UPI003A7FCDFC